jgi:hypothetical protein
MSSSPVVISVDFMGSVEEFAIIRSTTAMELIASLCVRFGIEKTSGIDIYPVSLKDNKDHQSLLTSKKTPLDFVLDLDTALGKSKYDLTARPAAEKTGMGGSAATATTRSAAESSNGNATPLADKRTVPSLAIAARKATADEANDSESEEAEDEEGKATTAAAAEHNDEDGKAGKTRKHKQSSASELNAHVSSCVDDNRRPRLESPGAKSPRSGGNKDDAPASPRKVSKSPRKEASSPRAEVVTSARVALAAAQQPAPRRAASSPNAKLAKSQNEVATAVAVGSPPKRGLRGSGEHRHHHVIGVR